MVPLKWTDGHTNARTDTWTFRLIDSIGPEGRCLENVRDCALSHKIDHFTYLFYILNLKGPQITLLVQKLKALFLNCCKDYSTLWHCRKCTWIQRVLRFLPDGLRHQTMGLGHYVKSVTNRKAQKLFLKTLLTEISTL